jgi:phytoene synthase
VLTAAVLYADHHRLVRERDCDVLSETPSLSTRRKLRLVAETRWHWFWNKDPETVFAKVSAVPSGTATSHDHPGEPMPAR